MVEDLPRLIYDRRVEAEDAELNPFATGKQSSRQPILRENFSMPTRPLPPCLLFLMSLALTSCNRDGLGVRTPTFRYVKTQEGGCANLFFHKGSEDRREVLWISADKKKLQLPERGSKTFDLAAAPEGLTIAVDLWKEAPRFSAYCNDISPDTQREATWKARKGKVTITVFEPEGKLGPGFRDYKASIRLEDVLFEDDAGNQATLKEETITEVRVGWLAG
jgi:hypothetical protein